MMMYQSTFADDLNATNTDEQKAKLMPGRMTYINDTYISDYI